MSIDQFQTTAIPSSFGMSTRGHLGTAVAARGTAVTANVVKRGYADWGTEPWSPSLC